MAKEVLKDDNGWIEAPQSRSFVKVEELEGEVLIGIFKGYETLEYERDGTKVKDKRAILEVEEDFITSVRILPNHINLMDRLVNVPEGAAVKISIVDKNKNTYIYQVRFKKVGA